MVERHARAAVGGVRAVHRVGVRTVGGELTRWYAILALSLEARHADAQRAPHQRLRVAGVHDTQLRQVSAVCTPRSTQSTRRLLVPCCSRPRATVHRDDDNQPLRLGFVRSHMFVRWCLPVPTRHTRSLSEVTAGLSRPHPQRVR
jgi:hypothetical protein